MTYNGSGMNQEWTWTGSGSGLELITISRFTDRNILRHFQRPMRDPSMRDPYKRLMRNLQDIKETHERHKRNQFRTDGQHLRDHWN